MMCMSSETDVDHLLWWHMAANCDVVQGEVVKKISRFVVVPAIPKETGSMRLGMSFCKNAPIGFDIYDNEEKQRLATTYQVAEQECQRLNLGRL